MSNKETETQVTEISRINYPPKPCDVARNDKGIIYMISMEELGDGNYEQLRISPVEGASQTFEIDHQHYRLTIPEKISKDSLVFPTDLGTDCEAEELLTQIKKTLSQVVTFPSESDELVVSLYLLATYTYDLFTELGYLAFTGLPGNGKSQALKACSSLAFSGLMASGGDSDASMLRQIDSIKGTLLIDEAQKSGSDSNALYHKILAQGNQSTGSISRTEALRKNDRMQVISYSVFGPKIFAGRSIPGDEAILSRTYEINMKPGVKVSGLTDIGDQRWQEASQYLRNDLLFYRQKMILRQKDPELIALIKKFRADDNFTGRERQVYNWLVGNCPSPLVYEELKRAIKQQRNRVRDIRSNQFEIQVLLATRQLLKTSNGSRILLKEISEELFEWGYGSTDSRYISKILRDNQFTTVTSNKGTCLAPGIRESDIKQALKYHDVDPDVHEAETTDSSSPSSQSSQDEYLHPWEIK